MGEIDPIPGNEARKLQAEQLQMSLEKTLATAKTASFGQTGSENAERARKLVEESIPPPVEVEKMTAEEAEAVRRTGARASGTGVKSRQFFGELLNSIGTCFAGLFSVTRRAKNQCSIYGHEPPVSGHWDGPHPLCSRCGTPIKSPDMLRKAGPIDPNYKKKPF